MKKKYFTEEEKKEAKRLASERFRKSNKEYYNKYKNAKPEEYKAYQKKYKLENPEKVKQDKEYWRNRDLKRNFGITLDIYNDMLNKQKNCCLICGANQLEFKKSLSVDHCHKTGKIRGLLCNSCNNGLGMFKDNIESLKNAIKYLQ